MCVASSKHISDGSSPWEFRDPKGAPTCTAAPNFRWVGKKGDAHRFFSKLEHFGGVWVFHILGQAQKSIDMNRRV